MADLTLNENSFRGTTGGNALNDSRITDTGGDVHPLSPAGDEQIASSDQTGDLQADNGPPLYSSRIINNYIEYLQEYYPGVNIVPILRYAGMSEQEVEDPGQWFSQVQADRFHKIVVEMTGNRDIPREAGRFSVSCKRIGAAKQYALGFVNPASVYLKIGKLAKTISRGAVMEGRKLGGTKVEIVSTPAAGTREKPYQCENRIGLLEAAGKIFTNNLAEVEHPSCFHRGDDCCRYIVSWEKTPAAVWKQIRNAAILTGLILSAVLFPFIAREIWCALVIASAFAFFVICSNSQRLEKKELAKTIESQGNAARDLMDEMDIRHSNALLIQEIGQAISKILDVDRIIDTVVAGMEKHLYFDRGMILLADPNKSHLQFKAGFGYTAKQETVLHNNEFSLKRPIVSDAEGFIIRAFKEQKSFVVKNIREIEKEISESRLRLVRQMGVESFICVPLVYEKEALGVLVVENNSMHRHIAQSEISLLMGVASQTAISMINARSIHQIKESEAQYRLLADNISDVIWIMDISTFKISYVSPSIERMAGFGPQEYMALELNEILPPESLQLARDTIAEELAKESEYLTEPHRSRTLQMEHLCKDGTTLWIELTASFLRDQAGEIIGVLGISRDISERRKAGQEKKLLEARLQQAQKMEAIGTLAGGIAHDFNNILSAVIGYTEIALEDAEAGTLMHNNLQGIMTAGNRAKDLIAQIMTFSRQADQELRPIQANLVVKEALKLLRASLPSTIEIDQRINGKSATLADPTQIHQVLMNLCTNSEHAMRESGGLLAVSLDDVTIDSEIEARKLDVRPGDYIRLQVRDNGHGMPDEIKSRIFDPFFTTKERGKGTGMGLAVVHGIVKSHRGAVIVQSRPGEGTCFDVYLPVSQHEVKLKSATVIELPTGTERVLLVDDEKTLVDLGCQMLERLGYRVESRTGSLEALALFKSQPTAFDLVITDMTMPNLTGEKLARELMEIRPDIPVILCTGFSEQISEERAKELGIREYILKPLLMSTLAVTVRKVLDGGRG